MFRTACVAKHSLLWKFLPRHKAAQKKIIFRFTNKWVKREASQSWNEVRPLKLFQARSMACHNHKSKFNSRCVLHKCIQTWHAPAVQFWTLEIAFSSSDDKRIIRPDKINTLAHGYRAGWYGKPTREPTGLIWEAWQSDRGGLAKWQGNRQDDRGTNRASGEATGWQGRPGKVGLRQRQGDPTKLGILRKIVRMPKRYLLKLLQGTYPN